MRTELLQRILCFFSLLFLILAPATHAAAQTKRKPAAARSSVAMRPYAFEDHVEKVFQEVERDRQNPKISRPSLVKKLKALEEELILRLKDDRFVTDSSLRRLGQAWQGLETPINPGGKATYKETLRYLAAALTYLEGRFFVQGELWMIRAAVLSNLGEKARALSAYKEAANQYEPVHVETDVQRMYSRLRQASLLLGDGKKEAAEPLILEVLAYPFFNVKFPVEGAIRLRDSYLQAARYLIEARRGNLAALKEIRLYPMADEEVGPILKEAIQQAEAGEKDKQ